MADTKKKKGSGHGSKGARRPELHDCGGRAFVPSMPTKPAFSPMLIRQHVVAAPSEHYSESAWKIDFNAGLYTTLIRVRVGPRKASRLVTVHEDEIFATFSDDGAHADCTQELLRRKITEAHDALRAELVA